MLIESSAWQHFVLISSSNQVKFFLTFRFFLVLSICNKTKQGNKVAASEEQQQH